MDDETIAAEVRAAFDSYEAALNGNDVDALTGLFWDDPRVVRLTADGGAYGPEQLAAFRKGRDASDVRRDLLRVDIAVLSPDVAVATAEYRRVASGRRGGQSQVWLRTAAGWRVASAHVSLSSG